MSDRLTNPSIWQYKPWWCQPWSIVLTGVTATAGSWALLHWLWLTAMVGGAVGVWWFVFLGLYPRALAESGLLEELAAQQKEDGM